MGLIEDLGPGPVAIDTCVLIYFIEKHPDYAPLVRPLFREAAAGTRQLFTSAISLLEVSVAPFRAGNLKLWDRYRTVLLGSREVRLVPLHYSALTVAAMVRGRYGASTPDALQIVAARKSRCPALVTNDLRMPVQPLVRIVQLESFVHRTKQS